MEYKENLRSLFFQEADIFLSVYDKDLNCLDVNDAFLKLYHYSREEVIGKNLCELSPDLKSSGRYDLYMDVIRTGKAIIIDHTLPHPILGNYHFRIRAFKVAEGLGLIVKDETDLAESVARFNFATSASREIIYELDMNTSVIWLNDAFYELVGTPNNHDFLKHEDYLKHIHPDDREKVTNTFDVFEKEQLYCSDEYRFIDKNDQIHYFAERAFILRGGKGKHTKKIASVSNITHWQQNINQLENILFDLSHKVRKPISNILGVSNLLEAKLINELEVQKFASYIKDSVVLLDQFTKEMTALVYEYRQKTSEKNWM
ncbi:MAG: PAS domain-containing protein [Bacteroidetes bacterium]|nr:PAS domain-containing protein [Bacteroidota bacterium]